MTLASQSSALLWEAAGQPPDEHEGEEDAQKEEETPCSMAFAHPSHPGVPQSPETRAIAAVNKDEDVLRDDDYDEEYTYNPDRELEEIQADKHAAYEGQQFYEKIQFGEFAKYMANKRRKLGVQQDAARRNAQDAEKSELLKGLRIHINGETEPPAHVLSHLVVLHGGVYVPYLDAKKTSATHIVAGKLTPSKRIAFKEYKVVRPDWLMESIRDMKIKDWRLYREDQTPLKPADIGVAPAGTQIAQPRLSFVGTAKAQVPLAPSPPLKVDPVASASIAVPPSAASTSKLVSPRRLPPPTSDPITALHVEGAAAAETAGTSGTTSPVPPYITEGWYSRKPNARSAELLKDERWRLNETAVNTTEFLEKYYKESRLHWLSTWKAELKKLVGELSEKQGKTVELGETRKKRQLKGTHEDNRVIMHIDFDSFFVSASLLARSHLKGQPVVVCHASVGDVNSSSEIASASYEARAFGIKNGMSLGSARVRCPSLQTVPYDFELYRSISAKFYTILFSHAQELEAVSIDEAYISLPAPAAGEKRHGKELLALGESIRTEIREATGLETSVGISHNKLLARLATNRAKPSSTYQIGNGCDPTGQDVRDFLADIDIECLPGIGWKRANDVEEKLRQLNLRLTKGHFATESATSRLKGKSREDEGIVDTVGKLLPFQRSHLKQQLGEKTGEMLYNYARGIDPRELETETIRKSVSAEVNYGIRFKSNDEVETFCHGLGGEVASRLANLGYKGRQLTLKVMRRAEDAPIEPPKFLGHGVCDVFNVSKPLELTNDSKTIGKIAWELMVSLACPPEELRGIGLQMQKLESSSIATSGNNAFEGQGRLTFAKASAAKPRNVVAALAVEAVEAVEAPEPILVAETSSPQVDTSLATSSRPRTAKRDDVNYVDISSSPEVNEEPLGSSGVRSLSQPPANAEGQKTSVRGRAAGQTLLAGDIVKRAGSAAVTPGKTRRAKGDSLIDVINIPATAPGADDSTTTEPPGAVAGVSASPTRLSDADLSVLGIDPLIFRSCHRTVQTRILVECLTRRGENDADVQKLLAKQDEATTSGKGSKKNNRKKEKKPSFAPVFEEAARNAAKREEAKRRELEKAQRKSRAPVRFQLDLPMTTTTEDGQRRRRRPPTFASKHDEGDIRKMLSLWMSGVGLQHAPALDEVEDLQNFCLESVSSDPYENGGIGPDIAKVAGILGWWNFLILQREKNEAGERAKTSGSQRAATAAWREAWTQVTQSVAMEAEKQLDDRTPIRLL